MSTKYPVGRSGTVGGYADGYFELMAQAMRSIDRRAIEAAGEVLRSALERGAAIYACGNGGSAAISNHLECDCLKSVQTDTDWRPNVRSLSANMSVITAIGNDLSFADIFVYQLRTLARRGDVLVTVSSSGDSENVVRAVGWARDNGVATIAMTGFEGGRTARLADINLHVAAANYGIVEDLHQSLMHILSQFMRQSRMAPELIAQRKF